MDILFQIYIVGVILTGLYFVVGLVKDKTAQRKEWTEFIKLPLLLVFVAFIWPAFLGHVIYDVYFKS